MLRRPAPLPRGLGRRQGAQGWRVVVEQGGQRQIDGQTVGRIGDQIRIQAHTHLAFGGGGGMRSAVGGGADHGVRTGFAPAQGGECAQAIGVQGEQKALLRFVAPDLLGPHAELVEQPFRLQQQFAAPAAVVQQFRHSVAEPTRPQIVDEEYGVVVALTPAGIQHLLAAPLHFRVFALHRGEIDLRFPLAGLH